LRNKAEQQRRIKEKKLALKDAAEKQKKLNEAIVRARARQDQKE
jgi:hypothetical protein